MRKNRLPPAGRNGHDKAPNRAPASAPPSNAAVNPDANGQDAHQPNPEKDPFQLLLRQFRELVEYFSYYLTARADSARSGLRKALFSITLAALAFVAVASLTVAATWFVLNGVAEGLGVLFGNRPWAGRLLTGLLLVAGLGGGMWGIVIRIKKTAREGTVAKYESRQARQQDRYGHNVADRAAANGAEATGSEQ